MGNSDPRPTFSDRSLIQIKKFMNEDDSHCTKGLGLQKYTYNEVLSNSAMCLANYVEGGMDGKFPGGDRTDPREGNVSNLV